MDLRCDKDVCDGRCNPMIISMASEVLGMGGLIVYPTETLYGIGGDALRPETYRRINKIKGVEEKNISVAYSSLEHAEEYVKLPPEAVALASKFLPGPLTIVVDTEDGTAGIRVPDHPLAKGIIEVFGPITSTSANIHGEPPARDIDSAKAQLGKEVDLYIHCGRVRSEKGSTVVKVNSSIKILREGIIPGGEIIG